MEADPQLLARLIKSGGRILVVGGGLHDLPQKYHDHPALLLWDDDRQGFQSKEVPQNTKAILYNRWVSHATAARLSMAAQQLHALKYPMLRTREIKMLLSEIVEEEKQLPIDAPIPTPKEIETVRHQQEVQEQEVEKEHMQVQPGRKGVVVGFVAKNLNLNTDWTEKGAMTREGERIFAIAQKENVKTTIGSITECVRKIVKDLGKPTFGKTRAPKKAKMKAKVGRSWDMPRKEPTKKPDVQLADNNDDFTELDRLMEEALAAIRLIQEHLPKVRKETERLRSMRQKMLDLIKA